mmetsp:Transcript_42049/g.110968  ORF Transcript_42049/g.110968 Transcript_42049/m.110968 type:complete len:659 (-) Transcript_42049:93-2069(-)
MAAESMAAELRMRINVKTKGMQKDTKKRWLSEFMNQWAPGHHRLTQQQFVVALGSLGIDKRSAEAMFPEVDADGNGFVDMHELNAVITGFRLPTSASAPAQRPKNEKGLLQGFSFEHADKGPQDPSAVARGQARSAIKGYLHKIGTRLQEKGFKNIHRVIRELDPDDSGKLDPQEMALFFRNYLSLSKEYSLSFFNLLDANHDGTIDTQMLAKRLEPYLHHNFTDASHDLGEWYEEEEPAMSATMKPSDARAMDQSRQRVHAQPAGVRSNASNASMGSRRGSGVLPGMDGADQTGSTRIPGTMSPMSPSSPMRPMSPQNGRSTPMRRGQEDMAPAGFTSARSNASSTRSDPRSPASATDPRSPSGYGRGGYPAGNRSIPEDRPMPQQSARRGAARGPQMPQEPPVKVDMSELVLGEFRKLILKRGGSHGIQTLGRTFRIMDTNRNQQLSTEELEIGLGRFGLHMKPADLDLLMKAIDKNGTQTVSYDEFMVAIRGQINDRRKKLILMAFDTLDRTRDGRVTVDDVASSYDPNHHPDVAAGNMHPKDGLGHFLMQFDCLDHDNCITKSEFLEYYKNVSASIDNDDYFELMIRNAWHIAGGSGWCANTSNKRILVTFNDGSQKVIAIEHDMGQDLRNHAVVQRLLDEQGVRNVRSWKLSG